MGEELLLKLIGIVESAAPKLWGIALKQVQVLIFQHGIACVFFVVVAIAFAVAAKHYARMYGEVERDRWSNESDYQFGAILCAIASIASATIFIACVSKMISLLINPEYYAIEVLSKLAGQ